MTGCDRYATGLGAYLDGELEPALASRLEAHLPDCEPCRTALTAHDRLAHALHELPGLEPGPQFEAGFWARLARDDRAGRGGLLRRGSTWALASAAALGAAALLFSLRTPALPDQPPPGGPPALHSRDWAIVRDAERFELLESADLELVRALDVLEGWDAPEES